MLFILFISICQSKSNNINNNLIKDTKNPIIKEGETNLMPIPISVPISQMHITGIHHCGEDSSCPDNIATSPCGQRCWVSEGNKDTTFEYTFIGVKVQIYGTNDPDHGKYDVYIDDILVGEIDQYVSKREDYQLQFTSDTLPYGQHTIKAAGKGNTYEMWKFAYWPSLTAKRLNVSDFTTNTDGGDDQTRWKTESDGIGGVRKYRDSGGLAFVKLHCSKFWIYGVKATYFPDVDIYFNGQHGVMKQQDNNRVDGALVYESNEQNYPPMVISFIPRENKHLMFSCIFYEEPKNPEITPIPISVDVKEMDKSGIDQCSNHLNATLTTNADIQRIGCNQNDFYSASAYNCGLRCWGNMNLNYTFSGVKFAIYGKYEIDFDSFSVKLDGNELTQIHPKSAPLQYSIIYESDTFDYGVHQVRLENNGKYEIYKLVYWPSMTAKRKNSTDFTFIQGAWKKETDGVGGVRHYNEKGNSTATISLNCSKFWFYGLKDDNLGVLNINYDGIDREIQQYALHRYEGALLYESPELSHFNVTITLTVKSSIMMVYCIYYEEPPIPISVSLSY